MLRQKNPQVREKWKEEAKQRAASNKAARALHKRDQQQTVAEAQPQLTADASDNFASKFSCAYMGQQMHICGKLGGGTFGQVFKVQTVDGLTFAVKVLKKADTMAPQSEEEMENLKSIVSEIAIHLQFGNCPYIVPALGVATVQDANALHVHSAALLVELCDSSLFDVLRRRQEVGEPVPETDKMLWCAQILAGLCHIHSQHIIHLDLKINNVLVRRIPDTPRMRAMICDFGLAKEMNAQGQVFASMNGVYNSMYRCPECTSLQSMEPCLQPNRNFLLNL